MAKSRAAYALKQAALEAASYKPHRSSLRNCTMRESKVGSRERNNVRSRKITKTDRLYMLAREKNFMDIARLIDRE